MRQVDTVVLDLPTYNLRPAFGKSFVDICEDTLDSAIPFLVHEANKAPAAISLDAHQSEQLRSGQLLRIKIFQLTEWVYKFLASATFPGVSCTTVKGDEVMTLYRDCLVWYDDVLAFAEVQGNCSASVLFAQ
jgi:hypothetical protein